MALEDFEDSARRIATEEGIDPEVFLRLLSTESGGNPTAQSHKGASGLAQLMPGTAREMGVKNPHDPLENMRGGARYLKKMLGMFGGDLRSALAAYNAGPGNVRKYNGIPPFPETQSYVDRISPLPPSQGEEAAPNSSAPLPANSGGASLGSAINQLVAGQYTGNSMPLGYDESMPQDEELTPPPQPETVNAVPQERPFPAMQGDDTGSLLARMSKNSMSDEPSTKSKIFQTAIPGLVGLLGQMFGGGAGNAMTGLATGFANNRLGASEQRHKLQYEQGQGMLQAAKENFKQLSGLNLDQLKDHAPAGSLQSVQAAWDKFSQALSDDKITPKEAKELNEAWGTVSGLMGSLGATQKTLEGDTQKELAGSLSDERSIREDIAPTIQSEFEQEQMNAPPGQVNAQIPDDQKQGLYIDAARKRLQAKKAQEATGVQYKDFQGNTIYGKPSDVNAAGRNETANRRIEAQVQMGQQRALQLDATRRQRYTAMSDAMKKAITIQAIKALNGRDDLDPIDVFNQSMDLILAEAGGRNGMQPPPGGASGGSSVGKYSYSRP